MICLPGIYAADLYLATQGMRNVTSHILLILNTLFVHEYVRVSVCVCMIVFSCLKHSDFITKRVMRYGRIMSERDREKERERRRERVIEKEREKERERVRDREREGEVEREGEREIYDKREKKIWNFEREREKGREIEKYREI